MPAGFRYSRWDGTQAGFDLDADTLLSQLNDDLIYHGDLNAALRRLLNEGVSGPDGERVAGLRELLERLRKRRQDELEASDLAGAFNEVAQELREIVDQEQAAIDRMERDAGRSGDERRQEVAAASADDRRMRLDLLPSDLAGRVRDLSSYEFVSAAAARRFDELVDRLRQELLQSRFNDMTGAMSNLGPEQLQRTKDMLAALNTMLDQRAQGGPQSGGQGIEADFAAFMASYGDFFPDNPQTLDELLEQLGAQMAAFQSFVNSLSTEQRAELARLSDELLGDMDLRWQLDQLSRNLQAQMPDLGWGNSYESSGQSPLSMLDAVDMVDRLGQIDDLEGLLSGATSPGALAEVDPDVARDLLGDDGARSLDRLAEFARTLGEAGLIEQREGRLELTPRGLRRLGQNALTDVFARLGADRLGHHPNDREGPGHERSYDTKAYEFGDPFNLNIERTIRNSLLRRGGRSAAGPVSLHPDDFEVERTETLTRASTVLAIDLSLSMPMRDNFLAAKKTAIALHSLISGRYPSDYLGIVGFSEVARALRPDQLPEVSWDFVFGTNMQHALLLARRMLAGRPGTRQVLMITDGEPTAHITADGEPLFHYPPTRETVDATLDEVLRCTREGIRINTFMLDATPHLQTFIERLSRINRGRVFFTTPETLGDYVLVDFIDQKRARRTGRSA